MQNYIHDRVHLLKGGLNKSIVYSADFNQNLGSQGSFDPIYQFALPIADPDVNSTKLVHCATSRIRTMASYHTVKVSPSDSTITAMGSNTILVVAVLCEYDNDTTNALQTLFSTDKAPYLQFRYQTMYSTKDSYSPINSPLRVGLLKNCRVLQRQVSTLNQNDPYATFDFYDEMDSELEVPAGVTAPGTVYNNQLIGRQKVLHVHVSNYNSLPSSYGTYRVQYSNQIWYCDIGENRE